jgi:hypothetical protein
VKKPKTEKPRPCVICGHEPAIYFRRVLCNRGEHFLSWSGTTNAKAVAAWNELARRVREGKP